MFRYTPSPVEEDLPKPEDDSDEVAQWFNTETDPEIARAVAKAEAEARSTIPPLGSAAPQVPLGGIPQQPPLDGGIPPQGLPGGAHRA